MHKRNKKRRDRERGGGGALKSHITLFFILEEFVPVE